MDDGSTSAMIAAAPSRPTIICSAQYFMIESPPPELIYSPAVNRYALDFAEGSQLVRTPVLLGRYTPGSEGQTPAWELPGALFRSVVRWFQDRELDFDVFRETAVEFPAPQNSEGGVPQMARVLRYVRERERGLIRYPADGPGLVQLATEIITAAPDERILVVTSNLSVGRRLRQRLAKAGIEAPLLDSGASISESPRVILARPMATSDSAAALGTRTLVLVLDALAFVQHAWALDILRLARIARLFGFLADSRPHSVFDRVRVLSVFGNQSHDIGRYTNNSQVAVAHLTPQFVSMPLEGIPLHQIKSALVWRFGARNRVVADIARAVVTRNETYLLQRFPPVVLEWLPSKGQRTAILVENIEHAASLLPHLPSWALSAAEGLNLEGVPEHEQQRLHQACSRFQPHSRQVIVTEAGLSRLHPVDVLIRADAGTSLPGGLSRKECLQLWKKGRGLIVDIGDRTHPQLRVSSHDRQEAYAAAGWPLLPTTSHGRLSVLTPLSIPHALAVAGRETKIWCRSRQIRPQDLLGLRADGDHPFSTVMLRLVVLRNIPPDALGAVDVPGPKGANLVRTATGQTLESDHVGNNRRKSGQGRGHHRVIDRPYGLRLASGGLSEERS